MPRTPRRSPNPPGRPAKKKQAAAALKRVTTTGESIEDAARAEGVAPSTVHAHQARRRAQVATAAPAPPSPASVPASPRRAPRAALALPQGGPAVSPRPDLLELLRRIGKARNGAAWAEVEEGLEVHQRGGEDALAPWLARPIAAVEVGVDELDALGRGVDVAIEIVSRAEAGGPQLRALGVLGSMAKSLASVRARRPAEPKPNEVQEAIHAEMDTCVEHLLRPVREVAAKLTRDRAALLDGLDVGPGLAAEIVRRVDTMLGGAT